MIILALFAAILETFHFREIIEANALGWAHIFLDIPQIYWTL